MRILDSERSVSRGRAASLPVNKMIAAIPAATAMLTRTSSVIENGCTYKSASSSCFADDTFFTGSVFIFRRPRH
jgi:hypothetical protein